MGQVVMHADAYYLDQDVGHSLNGARVIGALTDAQVVAADTNAGLQTAVRAFNGHSDLMQFPGLINRAIQIGKDDGSLTDAQILNETTVAGLVADTYADPLKPWPPIV